MALTFLTVKVSNPQNGGRAITKRLLVDSGAVYSVLPREDLKKLGIKADTRQKFILANNKEIDKDVGEARFVWRNIGRTAPVVFGNKGVYLLGATTLESMGLVLDPLNRKLEKLPMLL